MWKQPLLFGFLVLSDVAIAADAESSERELQGRVFDRLYDNDVCESTPGIYGPCDQNRFRPCEDGTLICYNRRPMRTKFHKDNRQPYYYIDYDSVFCYPERWAGCASCAPGRYCFSETRCILEHIGYPCEQWF